MTTKYKGTKSMMNYEQWRFLKNLPALLKNYNNKEIAKFIGVSEYTIRDWRTKSRKGKPI